MYIYSIVSISSYFFVFLSFFCVRERICFEHENCKTKQKKISVKTSFNGCFIYTHCECKCHVLFLIDLVIHFYFTICGVFLLLINGISQFFVMFHVHTMYRDRFLLKACLFVCFSLAGGYNLNWCKTEKKTRNGLT
jgi:hypothetical protein